MKRWTALMAGSALGLAIAGIGWAWVNAGSGTEQARFGIAGSRFVHDSPQDIVDRVDIVAIGTYRGETNAETPIRTEAGGTVAGFARDDGVRTFDLQEALKGPSLPGAELQVFVTLANSLLGPDGKPMKVEFSHPELKVGQQYVIFAKAQDPESNPTPWAFWGEPEIAEIAPNGELNFLVSSDYRRELGASGKGALGPAFDVTLEQLRGWVR